jgi:hypothetical protein
MNLKLLLVLSTLFPIAANAEIGGSYFAVIVDERNGVLLIQLRDPDNYIVQIMQLIAE